MQGYAKSLVTLAQAEDVDKLFAEYEAQAKADSAAAERKTLKLKNKRQKSMKEIRQEGLDAPIANDNKYGALAYLTLADSDDSCWVSSKSWHLDFIWLNDLARGFQMLAAMGYQPGRGLGRGLAGQAAPVPVQLKAGRQGVGIEQNKRRKQQEVEQQQKERGLCFAGMRRYITYTALHLHSLIQAMLMQGNSQMTCVSVANHAAHSRTYS